jgi:hypothetical protein
MVVRFYWHEMKKALKTNILNISVVKVSEISENSYTSVIVKNLETFNEKNTYFISFNRKFLSE